MKISSLIAGAGGADTSIFGRIEAPPGVKSFNDQITVAGGADNGIGLFIFASNAIKIATVIAGLYVLFNFITAGFDYITAGDTKANQKVREKLTYSILGLVLIVAAYTVIAVISLLLFGRPDYILNPQICGPNGC